MASELDMLEDASVTGFIENYNRVSYKLRMWPIHVCGILETSYWWVYASLPGASLPPEKCLVQAQFDSDNYIRPSPRVSHSLFFFSKSFSLLIHSLRFTLIFSALNAGILT